MQPAAEYLMLANACERSSRSGLSVTAPMGDQLRVRPGSAMSPVQGRLADQKRG